jgi:hypothetical protein
VNELVELMKQYGPAIGVLIIAWFRDKAAAAKHAQAIAELEKKFLENKADVEKKYGGMSSADIINSGSEGSD